MKSPSTRRPNIIAAAVFFVLGVVVFAQMGGLAEVADKSDPGAAGYPQLIAGIMIVLAVMLAFQRGNSEPAVRGRDALRVVGAVALLFVYVLTLQPLGYILSTIIMVVGMMLLMGIRSVLPLVIVPIVLSLSNFYLFYVAFGVPLPFSFLERLLS